MNDCCEINVAELVRCTEMTVHFVHMRLTVEHQCLEKKLPSCGDFFFFFQTSVFHTCAPPILFVAQLLVLEAQGGGPSMPEPPMETC